MNDEHMKKEEKKRENVDFCEKIYICISPLCGSHPCRSVCLHHVTWKHPMSVSEQAWKKFSITSFLVTTQGTWSNSGPSYFDRKISASL